MDNQDKAGSAPSGSDVLVLGATGMLGHAVLRYFAQEGTRHVLGTTRSAQVHGGLATLADRIVTGVDVEDFDRLAAVLAAHRPKAVINCVGVVKQLGDADDPLRAIPLNSLLPHRLARLCALAQARLVHVSTDCVFTGRKGMYTEDDAPDALDLYGRSKLLGEVDYPHAVTLRTSIVGHEIGAPRGLLEWFLGQQGKIRGFRKAIFSGLTTLELARVIDRHVLPDSSLRGVHHVSVEPISKLELLRLFATTYGHEIAIESDDSLVIDRSLDSSRFRRVTGYSAPPWPQLVAAMQKFG